MPGNDSTMEFSAEQTIERADDNFYARRPKELFESFPFSLKLSAALLRQKIKRLVTRGKQHCLIIALVTTEKRCRKNLRILAAKVYYCKLQTAKRTVLTTQHGIVGK